MFIYSRISIITICIMSLSGCGASLFTSRETNPSIQDLTVASHFWPWSKNAVNTFSTTASRRMVLVKIGDFGREISSCAEPSPDVGETFASAVSNALKLAVTEPSSGINGELSNDYAKAIATQITPLVYRTQALQLYRDSIHNLCIDKMNGWYLDKEDKPLAKNLMKINQNNEKPSEGELSEISFSRKKTVDANNYNEVKLFLFEKTIDALKFEIPKVIDAQKAFLSNQKGAGITVETIKEVANAIKNANQTTVTSNASGTTIVSSPNNIPLNNKDK